MSDDLGDAIGMLIGDVATSPRAADVAIRWGALAPSQVRPDGIRVECPASSPFVALEIRPWDADGYGLVDVELRPVSSTAWAEVHDRFGPFDEATATEGFSLEFVAPQPEVDGVRITLVAELDDEQVTGLTLRRDHRRSG